MLVDVLNPKLSIFFLALSAPFLPGEAGSATAEMTAPGGVVMATMAVFDLDGLIAGAFRHRILPSARAARLNRRFATILAALAGRRALAQA